MARRSPVHRRLSYPQKGPPECGKPVHAIGQIRVFLGQVLEPDRSKRRRKSLVEALGRPFPAKDHQDLVQKVPVL